MGTICEEGEDDDDICRYIFMYFKETLSVNVKRITRD